MKCFEEHVAFVFREPNRFVVAFEGHPEDVLHVGPRAFAFFHLLVRNGIVIDNAARWEDVVDTVHRCIGQMIQVDCGSWYCDGDEVIDKDLQQIL